MASLCQPKRIETVYILLFNHKHLMYFTFALRRKQFSRFLESVRSFSICLLVSEKIFFEIGYWKTFRLLSRFGRSLEKYYKLFKSLRLFGALISDETFWLIFMEIRKN